MVRSLLANSELGYMDHVGLTVADSIKLFATVSSSYDGAR
jgi:hypothetical protein